MSHLCSVQPGSSCIEIVPIFQPLSPEEMGEVEEISTHQSFEKGEVVYFAGETNHKLFVVHKGKIKISRFSEDGKEQVIRLIVPGEFMGELSLFSHKPTTDFAEALEPSVVCLIEGRHLEELMQKHPTIALKIMDELSKRLERVQSLVEDLNLHSVEWRLAQILLKMMDSDGVIVLSTTKGFFASQLGMTQETLSRKLTLWAHQSWIEMKGQRTIRVLRPDRLKTIE